MHASPFFFLPEQASSMAAHVDYLFLFMVAITVFFTGAIAVCLLIFSVKFRRRPGNTIGHPIHGSTLLEVAWSVVPFGITMVMFIWGAWLFFVFARPPDNAHEVFVVGKQWMWKLQHMEGRREINELHVPVGQSIKLTMTSEDVIHSFFVPAFRVKFDVVPGRYTTTWFHATKVGEYHLFCAEYCGTEHSGMIGKVIVMEPADFQNWLEEQPPPPSPPGAVVASLGPSSSPAAAGEALFNRNACATCHQPQGGALGPSLVGVFGSTVKLADGSTVQADEAYIRESILNPAGKVVAGYQPVMPTFQGQLNEEELMQLIQYIKSLKTDSGAPQGVAHSAPSAPDTAL
ncbi:MAG: cytochrome c oxidase subunit II [Candidatus Binatia bacterium]